MAIEFKLILLLQLLSLLQNADTNYQDCDYQDSESNEYQFDYDIDLEYSEERPKTRSNRNHYKRSKYDQRQKPMLQIQLLPISQMRHMPITIRGQPQPQTQMRLPQIQMAMPQMQMPEVPMPSMPIQTLSLPMHVPFINPITGEKMLYFPLSSLLKNFVKNGINSQQNSAPSETSTSIFTTTTSHTQLTEEVTTTPATTTTTSTLPPLVMNDQDNIQRTVKGQKYDDKLLEAILQGAINDYSRIIFETPEKTKHGSNYMLTSIRRIKPTWTPKFGIVPISDSMAAKMMSKMRTMEFIRKKKPKTATEKLPKLV